jgi:hypothetical protein
MEGANMSNNNGTRKPSQENTFILREIPAATLLDERLNSTAVRVLALLWCRADAKTGEVRINQHWFTQAELIRMAAEYHIKERAFRNAIKLLASLGYVQEVGNRSGNRRPFTNRRGEVRMGYGPQRYKAFKTSHEQRQNAERRAEKAAAERDSSSGSNIPPEENASPLGDSAIGATGNSSTGTDVPIEVTLQPAKSSATEDCAGPFLQTTPLQLGQGSGFDFESIQGSVGFRSSQESTNAKPSANGESQKPHETVSVAPVGAEAKPKEPWHPKIDVIETTEQPPVTVERIARYIGAELASRRRLKKFTLVSVACLYNLRLHYNGSLYTVPDRWKINHGEVRVPEELIDRAMAQFPEECFYWLGAMREKERINRIRQEAAPQMNVSAQVVSNQYTVN